MKILTMIILIGSVLLCAVYGWVMYLIYDNKNQSINSDQKTWLYVGNSLAIVTLLAFIGMEARAYSTEETGAVFGVTGGATGAPAAVGGATGAPAAVGGATGTASHELENEHPISASYWLLLTGFTVSFLIIIIALYAKADSNSQKPKSESFITSMLYGLFSFIIAGIASQEESPKIFFLALIMMVMALIGINLSVLKPDDTNVFSGLNLATSIIGTIIFLTGYTDKNLKHAKSYMGTGGAMLILSSLSGNLKMLGVNNV